MRNCFSSYTKPKKQQGVSGLDRPWDAETYGELLIVLIIMEALQEHKQLLLVPPQYRLNLRRLLRVRDEDL